MNQVKLPQILFSEQNSCSGFSIKKITPLKDIRSIAYEMFHEKSGAKLLYLQNDDAENLFSVAFKTLPYDDTGVPHILEHSVLCGSKRYPVKDPFAELLKTSLATFLNAMTYPDKTVYPCASMNEEDFRNILKVYCDAVFSPLLTEEHFKQEGHHFIVSIHPESKELSLSIRGIVYNEMKGVYSNLDGIIGREESKSILPDNCYGKDSGGDPNDIPSLTYEKFKDFYPKYYHPSNSYIIVYGSFDIKKTLQILDEEYLSKFTVKKIDAVIESQKRWQSPVFKTVKYPLEQSENTKKKAAVTINFLTNDLSDTLTSLSMSALELYLLDNSASPLRKALMDSQYGEALTNSGYADFQRDTFFTVGLKNIDEKNVPEIVKLVLSVCETEAKRGLNRKNLDSVFHRLMLDAMEIQPSYPLVLMDRVYDSWIYNGDPLCGLKLKRHLQELKSLRDTKPGFFENLLLKYVVNNKHYSVLTFVPDTNYHQKAENELELKLRQIKNTLTELELFKIKQDSEHLKRLQSQPNSEEAIASLPKLSISKIERHSPVFEREFEHEEARTLIFNKLFSNNVNYLSLALAMKSIPEDLADFLPVFSSAFLKMGTTRYDYTEMAEREALFTGGITSALFAEGNFDDSQAFMPYLAIASKSLECNLENMLQIVFERIHECDFSNIKRLKEVILQKRTALRSSIIPAGSSYALSFAAQTINKNLWLSERFSGISHIRFFNNLADNFNEKQDFLIDKLNSVKAYILKNSAFTLSFIGNDNQKKIIGDWSKKTDVCSQVLTTCDKKVFPRNPIKTGIIVPAAVAYNAGVFKAVNASDENAPALLLIGNFLTYNYLWTEIRMKHGAYGTKANYSLLNGTFDFTTYRDPYINESFAIFRESLEHIENALASKTSLEQAIIGALKKLDRPLRPENVVDLSLNRHLKNVTDEHREKFRTSLLDLTIEKVKCAVETILKPKIKQMSMCSISGKKQLEKANEEFTEPFTIENL